MTEIEIKATGENREVLSGLIEKIKAQYRAVWVSDFKENTRPPRLGWWRVYINISVEEAPP